MRALVLLSLVLVAGCTVPFNVFGRKPSAPPPAGSWEGDTAAADAAYRAGRLDEAEQRLEVARERAVGTAPDLELAASLANLAVVRRAQGDLGTAIDLQQQALALREQALGPMHPDVASTLNSIAALHAAGDDYDAAEPLLVRALAIREGALGRDDPQTAKSMNNLALLYAAQGRYAEAEPLYQRAIAIFEQHHEELQLATTVENYAALLEETGRSSDAAAMEERARALRATR